MSEADRIADQQEPTQRFNVDIPMSVNKRLRDSLPYGNKNRAFLNVIDAVLQFLDENPEDGAMHILNGRIKLTVKE